MTNVMMMARRTSGSSHAYRMPARSWPLARARGGDAWMASVDITCSATITAAKDAALTTKHQPMPTVAIRIPAMDGPMMRAAVNTALFRLTALATSSGSTSSGTKERRVGLSNAATVPRSTARTRMLHICTVWSSVIIPRTSAKTPRSVVVRSRMRRLSYRSATTPAHAPRSRMGRNCNA